MLICQLEAEMSDCIRVSSESRYTILHSHTSSRLVLLSHLVEPLSVLYYTLVVQPQTISKTNGFLRGSVLSRESFVTVCLANLVQEHLHDHGNLLIA